MRWTGQIALANALVPTGSVDEGVAAMKAAMGDLPSAAPMHAIADGYRRVRGRRRRGRARRRSPAAPTRCWSAFDFDPLGRAVDRRARPHTSARSCEVHGGRPEAALQTIRAARRAVARAVQRRRRRLGVRARPRRARRPATAKRNGRHGAGSPTSRGSRPGPAVMASGRGRPRVHRHRDEPSPPGRGGAVRARAAATCWPPSCGARRR